MALADRNFGLGEHFRLVALNIFWELPRDKNALLFFNTLFGSLNHFGQRCFTFSAKTDKREKKGEENYISETRYLNRLRFKQGSLVIEQKETGKSLYDFAMDVLILMLGLHVYVYSKHLRHINNDFLRIFLHRILL